MKMMDFAADSARARSASAAIASPSPAAVDEHDPPQVVEERAAERDEHDERQHERGERERPAARPAQARVARVAPQVVDDGHRHREDRDERGDRPRRGREPIEGTAAIRESTEEQRQSRGRRDDEARRHHAIDHAALPDGEHESCGERDREHDELGRAEHRTPPADVVERRPPEDEPEVLETDEDARAALEEREVDGADRRDHQGRSDEDERRREEDDGAHARLQAEPFPDLEGRCESEPQPDERAEDRGREHALRDRPGAERRDTEGAEEPPERGAQRRAADDVTATQPRHRPAERGERHRRGEERHELERGQRPGAQERPDEHAGPCASGDTDDEADTTHRPAEGGPVDRTDERDDGDEPDAAVRPRADDAEEEPHRVVRDEQHAEQQAEHRPGDPHEARPGAERLVEPPVGHDEDRGAEDEGEDDAVDRTADAVAVEVEPPYEARRREPEHEPADPPCGRGALAPEGTEGAEDASGPDQRREDTLEDAGERTDLGIGRRDHERGGEEDGGEDSGDREGPAPRCIRVLDRSGTPRLLDHRRRHARPLP